MNYTSRETNIILFFSSEKWNLINNCCFSKKSRTIIIIKKLRNKLGCEK